MRLTRPGGKLRLKQGGDEEPVSGRFDGSNLAFCSSCHNRQPSLQKGRFKLGIDLVVAEELLGYDVLFVEGMQVGSRPQPNPGNGAGKLRGAGSAIGDGAGHRRDHNVLRTGVVFRGIGVLEAQHIARTLYQSVLKAASSAHERPVAAAGKLNPAQHAVETLVRTACSGPESIERLELAVYLGTGERPGGDPLCGNGNLQFLGGVLDGLLDGRMGRRGRIIVPQNPNAHGIRHANIVNELFRKTRLPNPARGLTVTRSAAPRPDPAATPAAPAPGR